MKSFSRIAKKVTIAFLAFAIGIVISLKSGDIINNKLVAAGYRNRDFLGYIHFIVAFTVPFLMWLAVLIVTIPASQQVRKQIRSYTAMGLALAILGGELLAVFVFLVRYV